MHIHHCLILLFHKHDTAVYNGNRIYHIVKHLSSKLVSHRTTGIKHSKIYNGGIVMNLYIFLSCAEQLGGNGHILWWFSKVNSRQVLVLNSLLVALWKGCVRLIQKYVYSGRLQRLVGLSGLLTTVEFNALAEQGTLRTIEWPSTWQGMRPWLWV